MLRRIIKVVVVLGMLAAMAVGAGTRILRSDWLAERVLTKVSTPLGLDVHAESFSLGWGEGATLDTVQVVEGGDWAHDVRITGYVTPNRLLIEQADFKVLGGRLAGRARISPRGGNYYASVVADFNDLSLDQLVHAVDPNAGTHTGRLSGSVRLLPAFDRRLVLASEGLVRVTQSDLADNGIVRTLYNTLSLRFGAQEPTGTGELRLSFEGPAVVFSSVEYFNRGVEIRGAGTIRNVNLGAASPIEGYAVGSTRVLKGIKLPGLGALDHLLNVFQTGAASVKIGGTLQDTQVRVVPLPEVLGPFRRLLWVQLRE
jgi:hypothetical protein